MLVKLGESWVEPTEVVYLQDYSNKVSIVTRHGALSCTGNIDEFASIINNAGQSFGGEDEAPKEA